jgi:hypothetical protein
MTATATRTKTDPATDIDNLICCLEFLCSEALAADLHAIHAIIARTILEIAGIRKTYPSGRHSASLRIDILQAFKLLARFCLIEDPSIKQEVARLIESIDREALTAHAH